MPGFGRMVGRAPPRGNAALRPFPALTAFPSHPTFTEMNPSEKTSRLGDFGVALATWGTLGFAASAPATIAGSQI